MYHVTRCLGPPIVYLRHSISVQWTWPPGTVIELIYWKGNHGTMQTENVNIKETILVCGYSGLAPRKTKSQALAGSLWNSSLLWTGSFVLDAFWANGVEQWRSTCLLGVHSMDWREWTWKNISMIWRSRICINGSIESRWQDPRKI